MITIKDNSRLFELKNKYYFDFRLELYSGHRQLLIFEGENASDQLCYLVMSGCIRLSNRLQKANLREISMQIDQGLINVMFNSKPTGIRCKDLEIWTEEEYDNFVEVDEDVENNVVIAALNKSI